jgi:hypothetical protein
MNAYLSWLFRDFLKLTHEPEPQEDPMPTNGNYPTLKKPYLYIAPDDLDALEAATRATWRAREWGAIFLLHRGVVVKVSPLWSAVITAGRWHAAKTLAELEAKCEGK